MNKEWIQDSTALGGLPIYAFITSLFLATNKLLQAYQLVIGFAFFYAITMGIRAVYFKHRPERQTFSTLFQKIDASSFPSLHAARVTYLAIILSAFFQDFFVTIIFIFAALSVYITRVLLKRHYWIDVVSGIIIGCIVGVAVVQITKVFV